MKKWRNCFAYMWLMLLLSACATTAFYDQAAYQQAVNLKVEALALMDKATEAYAAHQANIEEILLRIEKAYEYDRGRKMNQISVQMWENLKNPDKNLLGGFLKRWKEKNLLRRAFIDEAKKLVGEAFDQIIQLESGKIKPGDVQL